MVFYTVLACTPLLVGLAVKLYYQCPINESKRAKRAFLFFSGLILFLVIALRDKEVGSVDSQNYFANWERHGFLNFEGLKDSLSRTRQEFGYICTIWVLAHAFPEGQWLFVFTGLFYSISVCLFIYRNSDNVVVSFLMFLTLGLYSFMVQGLRQSIAMCICLFAIESVKKRKIFRFLIQVFLAFCFHRSAVLFGMVYFIPWKKMCLVNKLQMLICAVLLYASASIILNIGVEVTKNAYADVYGAIAKGEGFVALSIYCIIIATSFFFIQHSKPAEDGQPYKVVLLSTEEDRRKETLFIAMTLIGATFYVMRYSSAVILERVSFFFMFGQIIVLPMTVKRFKPLSQTLIYSIAIILSVLLFMYRISTSDLLPYNLFF